MAARFWVTGGTGNWNSTTNWSATTGGASGASVPGSADTATLNASSGSGTVTLDISPTIQTLTCTGFTGTLAFGTNTISLNSTGTIFTGATTMAVTGTPLIICTNATATSRTITPGAVTEANSISFRITAGTGTLTLSTGSYKDLDFTDGTNPTGYAGAMANAAPTIYGNFKASTGMTKTAGTGTFTFAATSGTKTINTASVVFDNPFTFNGVGGTWQLQSNLTSGDTRTTTLTSGTLDLVSYTLTTGFFNSNASTTRTLAMGTGKVVVSGSNATVFTTNTATGLTVTGSRRIEFSYSGGTGTRAISGCTTATAIEGTNLLDYYITAGSDTVAFTSSRVYGTIDFYNAGASTFTGIFTNSTLLLYGNLAVKSGMTVGSGTGTSTFQATSGTKTITSNGQGLDFPITINGLGGTFQLADALNIAATSRTFTLTAGTFNTNGYALSVGLFSSSNANVRALNLGASIVTITGTGTSWNITDPTNLTFNAGTSSIVFNGTAAIVIFANGGRTYYNVTAPDSGYRFDVVGSGVFNQLTVPNSATAAEKTLRFDTNQTIGTFTVTGANGNCRVLVFANPPVVDAQITLTATSVSFVDTDFRDIAAAGAATPWTGTRLGNYGNNTNITFGAGKTVYWNKVAGGSWGDNAWALTSGGATSTLNQPLGQDVAVFDNTGLNAGSTVIFGNYLAGALDCSSLTNALIIQTDQTYLAPGLYKDVTLSSAVSFSGTVNISFSSRIATQYITSAGVNWSCGVTFNATVTVVLVDNLAADDVSFTSGSIDLNSKKLTCNTFSSVSTATRSIAFGSGSIDVAGSNATVWSIADLTGFSYTGTPTVNFTYSGSTGTRTIANGSTAGGVESNAVDFNITAGSDIVTMTTNSTVLNLNYTGFSGSALLLSFIYGNLTLSATQTVASSSVTTTFSATSGTKTFISNGVLIDQKIRFGGVGGAWTLQDALTLGATRALELYAGTFNTNGFSVTCGKFGNLGSLATGNRVLVLGSSSITIVGTSTTASSWQIEDGSYTFTVNAGASTINLAETYTGTSTQDFIGGGKTYYNLVYSGGQPSTIYGSNTFNSITNTIQPLALSFEAGSTQTVNNFNVSGTAGNLVTMTSSIPGTQWSLAKKTGGKVLVSYDSITDSAATPAGYWFAPTSQGNVNGGNNTGWNFGSTGGSGGFLPFF